MPEPDNTPTEEPTPEAPVEPTPTEAAPDPQENPQPVQEDSSSELPAGPVSASPTPGAVSDPAPEQTDNRERPEDGEQDVSQDSNKVPSNDEDPDVDA